MLYSDFTCALAHLMHQLNNAQRSHFQGVWPEIVVSYESVLSPYSFSFDRLRQRFSVGQQILAARALCAAGFEGPRGWWWTNNSFGVWNTPRAD